MIPPPGPDDAGMTGTPDGELALRVHMMPKDTNAFGTIFGGVILSLIDQAGYDQARKHGLHRWVTVAFDKVEFLQPVFTGDVVSLYTTTMHTGTTSIKIGVDVYADRYNSNETIHVTSGSLTMVSVDSKGQPVPFTNPTTLDPRDRDLT